MLIRSADSTLHAHSNEPNINPVFRKPTDLTMVGIGPPGRLAHRPHFAHGGPTHTWVLVPAQSSDLSPVETAKMLALTVEHPSVLETNTTCSS